MIAISQIRDALITYNVTLSIGPYSSGPLYIVAATVVSVWACWVICQVVQIGCSAKVLAVSYWTESEYNDAAKTSTNEKVYQKRYKAIEDIGYRFALIVLSTVLVGWLLEPVVSIAVK